ncbi:MAG: hypothetical protein WCT19_02105 [Candidatus Paceibacterota bacterium]|jgi:hypothetical protein
MTIKFRLVLVGKLGNQLYVDKGNDCETYKEAQSNELRFRKRADEQGVTTQWVFIEAIPYGQV